MKAPQERKTPFMIDHDHYEKVRLKSDGDKMWVSFKRDSRYEGGAIKGPEGVKQLRDFCQAWLDHHEE